MKQKTHEILLGIVSDDFTGASDVASFLASHGLRTMLFNGIPDGNNCIEACDAIVIALKTRNASPEEAVAQTKATLIWFQERRVKQYYIKYCSTFDSTPQGNIGPVLDFALDFLGEEYTILCPSQPIYHRVVQNGTLYVDNIPLSESHMRQHPLNPMWDSYIPALMKSQSNHDCFVFNHQIMKLPKDSILAQAVQISETNNHFYIIPDYVNDEDGEAIVDIFGNLKVLSGGSGLIISLAKKYGKQIINSQNTQTFSGVKGRGIILSGSCSIATREQINSFNKHGGVSLAISIQKLLNGAQSIESIWDFVMQHQNKDVLLYSEAALLHNQKKPELNGADLFEKVMAEISLLAYQNHFTRFIIAGGETSGAVALALNFKAFYIGESISPGVPIMIPVNQPQIRLVLKSGNFGETDFFTRALQRTSEVLE